MIKGLLVLALATCCLAGGGDKGSGWGYSGMNGPDAWEGICYSGKAQSPIDFVNPEFTTFEDFKFTNYHKIPKNVKVLNNGHAIKAIWNTTKPITIKGGGLNGTYEFAQLHFHWGGSSQKGSEHLVMGRAYPMEMHLVHFNRKYDNLAIAASKPDGLAVLGIFFQVSKVANNAYNDLFSPLSYVITPGTSENTYKPLALKGLLPDEKNEFFRYQGSLTTPPCAESVTWTVFTEAVEISEDQIYQLRSIRAKYDQQLLNNFRPAKPLNDRTLYVTKVNYTSYEIMPRKVGQSYRYDVYMDEPQAIDHLFLLIMSIIIFFMQCGFAFMEAGAVRSKNTVNILIKNWLDMCIGALVYWAVGFGLTFGESTPGISRFMGTSYFFFYNMPAWKFSKWFFQFVFAATAATLVSGSLAERCNFIAYIVYSVMITGFIYPIIAHWAWHRDGWLRVNGFIDFAGSGVVHMTGAICALVGCILMGPRIGRFRKDGSTVPMPGHSVPLSALGGLILIFGFFACNGTKQGSISRPGDGLMIATAIVNTALGTSAAGIFTLIFNKTGLVPGTGGNYSFLTTMNGALTGTVALCAGCNSFSSWASVIVGGLSGPMFIWLKYLMLKYMIDDPLDAIPVHGGGGAWGLISVYLFNADGIFLTWSMDALIGFGWNIVGLVTICAWTGGTCFIMFYLLKLGNMLRVETEHEFKGMDLLKHGESAYPADAWVEQQYMSEDAGAPTVGNDSGKGSKSKDGLPPNMKFSRAASYNNPHEMFPSASKLFAGMNSVAGGVTTKSGNEEGNLHVRRNSLLQTVVEIVGTREEKMKLNPDGEGEDPVEEEDDEQSEGSEKSEKA